MTRLAIIADDLSSATDCGAQVLRSGLSVVVPLGGYSLPAQARLAQVISVDTDTRSLPADSAYTKVKEVTQGLAAEGWTDFYKSVDSTLRGNLGAEIKAVLDVIKPDCAIVAPAFPKYGRTTREGIQYLHGRPLHETEFGSDPTAPVKDADICRRLAEGSARKSGRLSLDQVRAGPMQIQGAIHGLLAEGVELVVVDIAEQDDLKLICLGLAQSNLRILWVGSTGMAEFFPLAFEVTPTASEGKKTYAVDPRPALALVGSGSETTREQLRYAETHYGLNIVHFDPARVIQNKASELEETSEKIRAALNLSYDVALVVRASRDEIAAAQQLGSALNMSPAQVAQSIAYGLAQVASRLVYEGWISGIVATGGDTSNALCKALGAQALEILGEVEAGIPILRVIGEQTLPLVTKAGGFGSLAAMADALGKVKQYA
jgi:uncharacterized protein YgbK (DUF1537 family)